MTPFTRMKRGQSSVELLIVLAISLTILATLISFTTTHVAEVDKQQSIDIASASLDRLVKEINQVYLSGPGKTRDIVLPFPKGIDAANSRFEKNSIILRVYETDISRESLTALQGTVPTTQGLIRIRLTSYTEHVNVSSVSLVSDTGNVYLPMARDSNASATITFTNLGSNTVDVVYSFSWTPTLIGGAISHSIATLTTGQNDSLRLDFNAGASALGNYVGFLNVQSTAGRQVETFSIPVNVEVFSSSQTLLTVIPSFVSYRVLGADFNAQSFQLCNAGNTPIKSISITPSTSPPGSWVSAIPAITQLDPSACQYVDVNSTVPAGVTSGTYAGSLAVTDYTGANNQIINLTANVETMADYFTWEWGAEVAAIGVNDIGGMRMHNASSKPITISTITIRRWWDCDVNHSTITSLRLNGSSVFTGNAADGNIMDVTDTNVPAASYIGNNLISFSNPITDVNSTYQPIVTFSDLSSYTGPTTGVGCILDVIPPGLPITFSAATGTSPESILVSWTYPGDDAQIGSVYAVDLRYSTSPITTDALFASATPFQLVIADDYDDSGTFPIAGAPGSELVTGLNVGQTYYFSILFFDEADNNSGLSSSPSARPFNMFAFSAGDVNIVPFAFSRNAPIAGELDVNQFLLSNLVLSSGDRNVYLHVIEDSNSDNAWYAALGFSTVRLNDVRIWYPASSAIGIPQTAPNFSSKPLTSFLSGLDMLSAANFNTEYRFNGNLVNIPNPSRLYVEFFQGFSDMNITFDQAVT